MNHHSVILLAAGVVLLFAARLEAAPAAHAKRLPPEFMPSSELEVGMKITGKTVFEGTEIEEFTGEIVGVERGAFAGSNLIWALLDSPRLGAHSVASGMSGSPCYVDGRLIGAVGYGFHGSQQPLAGITPIEGMLEVFNQTSEEPHPSEEREAGHGATVGVWDIEQLRQMARSVRLPTVEPIRVDAGLLTPALRAALPAGASSFELKPLALPIGISTVSPEVYRPLAEFLESGNMSLMPGAVAAGTADASALPPLEAGSALGMPLMTGDLTIGGYGTVTYRDGDRLIGFGHPAFGWGDVDIPMSPCSMFIINPSYFMTFKVGEVATPIGAIRQDRLYAVGGVVGKVPRRLPMTVRVHGMDGGTAKEFRYDVWDNRYFTPALVAAGMRQAVTATDRTDGDTTLEVAYTIDLDEADPIHKRLFFATSSGPAYRSSYELAGDVALLSLNPFRKAAIRSIDAEVRVTSLVHQAAIVSVTADKDVYRPGETVRLTVYIQPYRGPREKRVIEVPLESNLRDGLYDLFVGDSAARLMLERSRAPGLFTPMNFQQVVEAIRTHYLGNAIYVALIQPDQGVTVHGQEMPSLPPSLRGMMSDSNEGAFILPTSARILSEHVVEGETEFVGSVRLALQVSRTGRR